MIEDVQAHDGIDVLTNATVADTQGFVGNFKTTVDRA